MSLWGQTLLVLASFWIAVSGSFASLIAARAFQGVGAAAIVGMNGALVRMSYPRAMLGRGIGFNAIVVSLASTAGPGFATAILSVASWR